MKTSTILLVLGAAAIVGVVVFFATQSSTPASTAAGSGPGSGASGIVRSIGSGITGLLAAIVGGVEEANRPEPEDPPPDDEAPE